MIVFALFFYASFGSPNIHLSLLVSKFTVARSREAFEKKWPLTLLQFLLVEVIVMNSFSVYQLD